MPIPTRNAAAFLAQTELARLAADSAGGKYVSHYAMAVIQAGLGNNDQALIELERARAEHAWSMFLLRLEPAFDGLHSDARFAELLQKVGDSSRRQIH